MKLREIYVHLYPILNEYDFDIYRNGKVMVPLESLLSDHDLFDHDTLIIVPNGNDIIPNSNSILAGILLQVCTPDIFLKAGVWEKGPRKFLSFDASDTIMSIIAKATDELSFKANKVIFRGSKLTDLDASIESLNVYSLGRIDLV